MGSGRPRPPVPTEDEAARAIVGMFRKVKARKMIQLIISSVVKKKYDPETKTYFYVNSQTGEASWDKPALLQGDLVRVRSLQCTLLSAASASFGTRSDCFP